MRGTEDEAIEMQQSVTSFRALGEERAERPQRPPGGKALVRLLQLLESAGYAEAASAAVERAVSNGGREELAARAAQFSAAPDGQPAAASAPAAPRSRRGARSAGA